MALPPSVVKDLIRLARGPASIRRDQVRKVLRVYLKTKKKDGKRASSKSKKRLGSPPKGRLVKFPPRKRKKPVGLLSLPRELRDIIYDLVFEESPIAVHTEYKFPGLLAVNRQIRHETQQIYFKKNDFELHIKQWQGNLFLDWANVCLPFHPRIDVCLHKSHNWVHLKMFMREIWAGGMPSHVRVYSMSEHMSAVFRCAACIALAHSNTTWDECDRSLDTLYDILLLYEPDWDYVWHDWE